MVRLTPVPAGSAPAPAACRAQLAARLLARSRPPGKACDVPVRTAGAGSEDGLLVRYDDQLNYQWSNLYGGLNEDSITHLDFNEDGDFSSAANSVTPNNTMAESAAKPLGEGHVQRFDGRGSSTYAEWERSARVR